MLRPEDAESLTLGLSHGEAGPSASDSRTHVPTPAWHGSDHSGHGHAARQHWSLPTFTVRIKEENAPE